MFIKWQKNNWLILKKKKADSAGCTFICCFGALLSSTMSTARVVMRADVSEFLCCMRVSVCTQGNHIARTQWAALLYKTPKRNRKRLKMLSNSWLQAWNWAACRRSQGCFAVTLRPKCADCTSLIAARDSTSSFSQWWKWGSLLSGLSESSTTTLQCYVFLIPTDQNTNTISILAVDDDVWLQMAEC